MQQDQVQVVMGVQIGLVDEPRLKAYARGIGVKFGPKDDVEKLTVAVMSRMVEQSQKDPERFLQCDDCGAISPDDVTCPFCGEDEVEEKKADAEAEEEAEEEADEPGSRGDNPPARDAKAEASFRKKLAESQNVLTSEKNAPEKKNGLVKHTNGAANGHAAVVVHANPKQDLKSILEQTRGYVRDWTSNAWDIGDQLGRLFEESPERPALWKLLKDDDKVKQRYRTFTGFTKAELGLSEEMTKTCLYIAREYTREQLPGFSISKLSIVLNAPESQQRKLMAKAGAMPASELRENVRELNIAQGKKLKAQGQKDPTEKRRIARQKRAKQENAAKDAAKGVTTFVLKGAKGSVLLYRKQKDAHGKLTPAHSLADNCGWITGMNGVALAISVTKLASGKLRLTYEAKREEV